MMTTQKVLVLILTLILCTLTLTNSEVIESDSPKETGAIDAENEAPYSAVGKGDSVSDVTTTEDSTETVTSSATTTVALENSYGCREYGYCRGTLFPEEVTLEGNKRIFCRQGINPIQHCCLPVTRHFVCYNIKVKDQGRLSLGDGSQKHETDFTALCREMLKTQNHTVGRYTFVSKSQGSAEVVYRHGTWFDIEATDSHYIEDLACEYYVPDDDDVDEADVTDDITTTETPEEEEEEEEDEDEDEEEREKKEREREEGGSDGGGGGSERDRKGGDEDEEEEEEEEKPKEEQKEPERKKKKKKGRRN